MGRGTKTYGFLSDPVVRTTFYTELNAMLQGWEYQVVARVIKKGEYLARYAATAVDPYLDSLDILVERFCLELGYDLDAGFICAEKRNPSLDRELMQAWEELRTVGTSYAKSESIDSRVIGLDLRDKKPNLAGLQLADLVITPIGRHVAGKTPKAAQVQWSVVERKLWRVNGTYEGKGLVIRP
ncbi:MAG: DUF3800 domain-containing protein [Thermomicrobiales bacterium]|jgi:hypothetical protein